MDFAYYVVRKKDMVILDGANDMVGAINMGNQQNCACLILQACVITEVGQDILEDNQTNDSESPEVEIIEEEE